MAAVVVCLILFVCLIGLNTWPIDAMVSAEVIGHAANNFLLFSNILQTLKIDQLIVPETVAMTSPDVVLDCQYSASDDRFVLQWFVNASDAPVYRWRPWHEPEVHGVLEGRLDLNYRASTRIMESRRALRIVQLDPDLSGEYTCKVTADDGAETSRSASMIVFSPEREFSLQLHRNATASDGGGGGGGEVEATCEARGLHPQPDLTLEHDGQPVATQVQRVWRGSDGRFDAATRLRLPAAAARRLRRLTCRLRLPAAGYVVIKHELIYPEHKSTNGAPVETRCKLFIVMFTYLYINMFLS